MSKRFLLSILLPLLTAQVSLGESEWLEYDPYRRVPWADNPAYERCDYDWWINNTGESSDLFYYGLFYGSEFGTNSIRVDLAWAIHPQGVSIGVVDINNAHGQRVSAIAGKVSRNTVCISNNIRLYPEDVAASISNFVSLQFKVIVVTTGFNYAHAGLSNACRFAEFRRALIFCAVPNAEVNIDVTPDYPSSWAAEITSIVPITPTDRHGNLYGPGAAASGTNVTGCPGRNIINEVAWTYSSGSSVATPIAAGCGAILMQYRRGRPSVEYRNALWNTSAPAGGISRIDPVRLLQEF